MAFWMKKNPLLGAGGPAQKRTEEENKKDWANAHALGKKATAAQQPLFWMPKEAAAGSEAKRRLAPSPFKPLKEQ